MKKLLAMLVLMSMMLTACSEIVEPDGTVTDTKELAKTIQKADEGQLAAAKKYIANVKAKMQETVKDEYFESAEWTSFVDAFWDGYNQGQEMMKNPQYMPLEDIEY